MLMGVGRPEHCLDGNFHVNKDVDNVAEANHDAKNHYLSTKWFQEGVKTAFSAPTCVDQPIGKLETMMDGPFLLATTPMANSAHPELDDSPMLDSLNHSRFLGTDWMCQLASDFRQI